MRPKKTIHPGEILLEEFLKPMDVTQRSFAKKIGWTTARLNELIRGKRGITADSALDLAKALKTSPEVWMNLQLMWDLHQAQQRRRAS
jgi:addiction module HigA family antidote